MRKSIYLSCRNSRLSHDQFVRRWRQHGALAMSKSFFRHIQAYVQAEVLVSPGFAHATQDYDAIAYIISSDRQHTAAEIDELKDMVIDEYETFFDAILPHLIQVEERVVKAGPLGGTTAFLFFLDAGPAEDVALSMARSDADRVILNLRLEGQEMEGLSADIPYRAVVEASARDLRALADLVATDHGADLLAVTQECVMWDRLREEQAR